MLPVTQKAFPGQLLGQRQPSRNAPTLHWPLSYWPDSPVRRAHVPTRLAESCNYGASSRELPPTARSTMQMNMYIPDNTRFHLLCLFASLQDLSTSYELSLLLGHQGIPRHQRHPALRVHPECPGHAVQLVIYKAACACLTTLEHWHRSHPAQF